MHGTRGTTGSEDCLLLYSGVGNTLIFPIHSFACTSRIRSRSAAGGVFILQASCGLCRGGRAGACGVSTTHSYTAASILARSFASPLAGTCKKTLRVFSDAGLRRSARTGGGGICAVTAAARPSACMGDSSTRAATAAVRRSACMNGGGSSVATAAALQSVSTGDSGRTASSARPPVFRSAELTGTHANDAWRQPAHCNQE